MPSKVKVRHLRGSRRHRHVVPLHTAETGRAGALGGPARQSSGRAPCTLKTGWLVEGLMIFTVFPLLDVFQAPSWKKR